MPRLNQILAIVAGEKGRAQKGLTELYKTCQKPALFSGLTRTYRPKDEEGETLPPESKRVQVRVRDVIAEAWAILAKLFDTVATQDFANCEAKADVRVNGTILLPAVPVTYLLFLEKQLVDLHTFADHLPTLDPAYEWERSDEAECYATPTTETVRTKKIPRNHEKAPATEHHPAQVDVYTEDVTVGYWAKIEFNGGIQASEKTAIQHRIRDLQDAVKMAREEANTMEVTQQSIGQAVFNYIF